MIQKFKEHQEDKIRTSALVYRGTFNAIKELYEEDPKLAGELAISAIELVLTGDISSNSKIIGAILAETKDVSKKHQDKYDNNKEQKRQKRIDDLQLEEIARLVKQKLSQAQIGQRLGLSQQAVSKRVSVIRGEFPELLQDNTTEKVVQPSTNKEEVVQTELVVESQNGCENNKYNLFRF